MKLCSGIFSTSVVSLNMLRQLFFLSLWALHPTRAASDPAQSFDYVIVGGGTAGLTVANRLSEDPDIKVAIVEAGGHIDDVVGNLSQVPGYVSTLQATVSSDQSIGWGFKTTPQQVCANSLS